MQFNFLPDRIEISHERGKVWDSSPDLYFNDKKQCLTLTFLDETYTKYFQNRQEYLNVKAHCDFYFT
jgi:hypothetical protein